MFLIIDRPPKWEVLIAGYEPSWSFPTFYSNGLINRISEISFQNEMSCVVRILKLLRFFRVSRYDYFVFILSISSKEKFM